MRQPPELAEELPAFHVRNIAQKCARVNADLPAPGAAGLAEDFDGAGDALAAAE